MPPQTRRNYQRRRRVETRRQRQRGGKKIGEGSYGCVYRPPLLCEGEVVRRENTVSKLMKTRHALDEIKENAHIDRIDPEFEFHLPPPEMCSPAPPDKEHDKNFKGCDIVKKIKKKYPDWKERNMLTVLQMPDGGMSLSKMSREIKNATMREKHRFMKGLGRLFRGVHIMNKNDFLHYDIKRDNVVVKREEDGTYRFNFIDFGLAIHNVNTTTIKTKVFNKGYFVRPLELTLLDSDPVYTILQKTPKYHKKDMESVSPILLKSPIEIMNMNHSLSPVILYDYMKEIVDDSYASEINDVYVYGKENIYLPNYETWRDTIYPKYIRDIDQFKLVSNNVLNKDAYDEYGRMLLRQSDVFSMGIMLVVIWNKIYGVKFELPKPSIKREVKSKLYDLIRDLTEFRYDARLTPNEAYRRYNEIIILLK